MKEEKISIELQQIFAEAIQKTTGLADSISEMINKAFTPEVKKAIKSISAIMEGNRTGHKTFTDEYKHYFESKGIIYTKNTDDFLDWFYLIYCEGENDGMFDIVSEHHFKLYHEYKERLFNGGWSDEKEREYLNFDSNDATNPLIFDSNDFDFDKLENSGLPVIDSSIFDPNFIFDEYHNKAFTCSRVAFDAWMVHGKKCNEKIEWIYKTRDGKINKAQLKMFIDKITNTDTAKEAYFKNVFGIEVNKSDYRNASLAPFFKDLSHISDKKKFLK